MATTFHTVEDNLAAIADGIKDFYRTAVTPSR
jgi:hypothetical protein